MNLLTALTIVGIALIQEVTPKLPDDKGKVKVTVLYESLCHDSRHFIVHQLYNTWEEFKFHIRLDLVPYGKTNQTYKDGHFVLNCQNGPEECMGNKLHACAIYQACGEHGTLQCPTDQLAKAMDYIYCVMPRDDPQAASDECASQAGLEPASISQCANGKEGLILTSLNGNKTAKWSTGSSENDFWHKLGVPFIVINNSYSAEEIQAARHDFRSVIRKYIPVP